jgi:hypothetical protein
VTWIIQPFPLIVDDLMAQSVVLGWKTETLNASCSSAVCVGFILSLLVFFRIQGHSPGLHINKDQLLSKDINKDENWFKHSLQQNPN